jgi:hypothetical protein
MRDDDSAAPVPERYRGVWVRSLLTTPTSRDDTTFVRWLQTSRWHADLRVPPEARPDRLALQQGFCGVTTVEVNDGAEVCRWHRRLDFQPPGPHPDAGHIVFEGTERLIETGVHADYLEVWERLPGSTGRFAVLEASQGQAPSMLLVSGEFAMRVRPRHAAWPSDTTTADTLRDLVQRHPAAAPALLDFEISFGRLAQGRLHIAQSSLPALEGSDEACRIERVADDAAVMHGPAGTTPWRVLEWSSEGGEGLLLA